MVDRSQIRENMDVIDSSGEKVGRVGAIEGEGIRLTGGALSDGKHHVDIGDVARIDEHVHLSKTGAALGLLVAGAGPTEAKSAPNIPLPPIRNPAVGGAEPRRNYMLPWVLAALALLALVLALSQCDNDDDRRVERRSDRSASTIVTPRVAGAPLRQGTLAFEVDRFMGSKDGVPRTFTFESVNFDSGTANLRTADNEDLNDLARVLDAYPESRAAIVGYADAQGDSRFNRDLGANRAQAVIAALATRGVVADRLEARSGGETNPNASNATPGGRFENRRTELVILER